MSSPNPTVLQQLHRLDSSSSSFHIQLSNVLDSEQYERTVSNLEGNDLVSLVDYLDQVRSSYHFLALCSSMCRLLTPSVLQVPVSVNV